MAVRIISALVAIPLLLFFIIFGGLPLRCAVFVLSLIGMYELYKAVSGKVKVVHIVGFVMEGFYFASWFNNVDTNTLLMFFSMAIILIMLIMVICHKTNNIHDGAITVFGFFYLGVLLSFTWYLREVSMTIVWLPFIFAFGSDTGAYFIGSKFGKHKLTPELSPKKSVEGAVGGFVTSAILTAIYSAIVLNSSVVEIIIMALVGAVGSVFAQFGDLAASSIKRYVGIKDYGKLMPGHGGVLDRFDSVLFTLPYTALVFSLILTI